MQRIQQLTSFTSLSGFSETLHLTKLQRLAFRNLIHQVVDAGKRFSIIICRISRNVSIVI